MNPISVAVARVSSHARNQVALVRDTVPTAEDPNSVLLVRAGHAAILILLVNLLGGIAIGPLMHDMSLGDAARVYTTLTIGDGLVAQIPALLLSMAVAVIGGLITSTFLSLLVIPVVFTYLDDVGLWAGRMFRRLTAGR